MMSGPSKPDDKRQELILAKQNSMQTKGYTMQPKADKYSQAVNIIVRFCADDN